MAFLVDTLKTLLPERSYNILTDRGNDDVGQQALDSAENWVNSVFLKAAKTIDLTDESIIDAVYHYAAYWLYLRNRQPDIGQEYHKKAKILIETFLGEAGSADPEKPRPSGPQASYSDCASTPGYEFM